MVPRYDADKVVQGLSDHKITVFAGGPAPIYMGLLASPMFAKADLSQLRYCPSGGAPCPAELHREWLEKTGQPILEGWGMTEGAPFCLNVYDGKRKLLSVGNPVPGTELQVVDLDNGDRVLPQGERGELRVRGPQMGAGYRNQPEETARTYRDGWVHTGDIAEIDTDGFVTITDRKKDILVTAGGKNIAPQNIENDLKASKIVSQAIVVGDRRPYPAALITLDPVEIEKWAEAQGITGSAAELASDESVRALVQGIVDDVNRDRSRYEQLKRFAILPRDFTMENDEVTPTLKLKRKPILEHFADAVESLYEP